MRYFLLNVNLSNIEDSKKLLDVGRISGKLVELSDCIRSSLFLSHGIRRDTRVFIFDFLTEGVIDVKGESVKYMGTDLRSISILMLKAIETLNNTSAGFETSTPGIDIVKVNPIDYLKSTLETVKASFYWFNTNSCVGTIDLNNNWVLLSSLEDHNLVKLNSIIREFEFKPLNLGYIKGEVSDFITVFNNQLDLIEYDAGNHR